MLISIVARTGRRLPWRYAGARKNSAFAAGRNGKVMVYEHPQTPVLMKVGVAATELSVGITKIYELIAEGELATVHIGRAVRITSSSLRKFVERLEEDSTDAIR